MDITEHKSSFYVILKRWYNYPSLAIVAIYTAVSFFTMCISLYTYCVQKRSQIGMSNEVRDKIFRKYIIYFIVLNVMESPYILVCIERLKIYTFEVTP